MSIEKNIERIADALEILAGIKPLMLHAQEPEPEVVAEPIKSMGRPKKEKVEKEVTIPTPAAENTSSITIEVLRARARQLGELDRPAAVAIVTGFKVPTLGDIPPDQFESAYRLFDAKIIELQAAASDVL